MNRTAKRTPADSENSAASLARHILAIHDHPLTPPDLWNAIAAWVTDATNIRISACERTNKAWEPDGDISLIEDWTWQAETIERLVHVSNVYNDNDVNKRS